jgi:hypothetical protein
MRIKRQNDHYYRCNGRQQARGLYGIDGRKCPAKRSMATTPEP